MSIILTVSKEENLQWTSSQDANVTLSSLKSASSRYTVVDSAIQKALLTFIAVTQDFKK